MNKPIVSIVVNNFNNEPYLADCLESLVNQTHKGIEIVVVDALSTDSSRTIIDHYANRYSFIKRVYSDEYIKFPATSYNLGFLNCTGDYIAINDPDDISLPTRIQKQLEFLLDNPNVDVVGSNAIEFNESFERKTSTTVEKNVKKAAPPARNPCLMFNKKVLAENGLWRWQCEYAADFEWLYRWYCSGVKFHVLEEPLVKYRYGYGGNISSTRSINQTYKLALFRTTFGLKIIKIDGFAVGIFWWITTFETYYYLCSLFIKRCAKIIFNRNKNK